MKIELKNNYKLNGIPVIEYGIDKNIDGRYPRDTHYVILENGEKYWFSKKYILYFQTQCTQCKDRWSAPIKYAIKREDKTEKAIRKSGISRDFYLCPSCLRKGKGNPMYGQNIKDHMTPEAYEECCRKRSINAMGENNPMYGQNIKDHMTPEAHEMWRQHLSDANDRIWTDPVRSVEVSKNMSNGQKRAKERDPKYYSEIKSRGGIATTSNPAFYKKTKPEIAVENWLIKNGIEYTYSPIMGNGKRNFQFDFIVKHKRILIEVNGDYWHGNPLIFKESELNHIQQEKRLDDIKKKEYAISKGFTLLTIWEYDINRGDFSALNSILQSTETAQ